MHTILPSVNLPSFFDNSRFWRPYPLCISYSLSDTNLLLVLPISFMLKLVCWVLCFNYIIACVDISFVMYPLVSPSLYLLNKNGKKSHNYYGYIISVLWSDYISTMVTLYQYYGHIINNFSPSNPSLYRDLFICLSNTSIFI